MPQSGVAEVRGDRGQHDERRASLDAARAALLEWDARERELERLPSAVRALDDWSTSADEVADPLDWSAQPRRVAQSAGRRTVTIRGQVADRYAAPSSSSRRRPERRYERSGFRPDRVVLWAFVLGVMLILAAVTSAHAATLHAVAHLH
ncbi:MAG TPA: hypothetical protein VE571_00550 [Solirubrobacteraceae bacterium]|jgi:hypothetical protein|nr:hypothetical protein [Solirubrobacteraceae bacterium]